MDLTLLTYATFVVMAAAAAGLHYATRSKPNLTAVNNPVFLDFQRGYFLAYFPALFADWLQGPYLYKLYSVYGFTESQIAILYVCGTAASVIAGYAAPSVADRVGRRALSLAAAAAYALSCLMKLSRDYFALLSSRAMAGGAAALLFAALDAWCAHEHTERHDFPGEWRAATASRAARWNAWLAVAAGLVANVVVVAAGPASPYVVAVLPLAVAAATIAARWPENCATTMTKPARRSCSGEALRRAARDEATLLLGGVQAAFESVMSMFVFLWTPILDPARPPLGVVFAAFMLCVMVGGATYELLRARVAAPTLLAGAISLAIFAMLLCVGATHPEKARAPLALVGFAALEVAIGVYFPAMGYLRRRLLPDAHRAAIVGWFRVPLTVLTCAGLIFLHGDVTGHGNRIILIICLVLLLVAMAAAVRLLKVVSNDERLATTEAETNEPI
ncbi:PREDICTED: molybdate-anion transporter-like [Priapulus caudatus]|uniref:Molybdate-anion transporter n=1 Tax=Priapulus caudatus TaxID=37621 RepID=A0ABM1F039_PRICU|nr:PREDICTED: molybdate-anion transporter-like [Priapulus caudatus]